jgi:septum formation protein
MLSLRVPLVLASRSPRRQELLRRLGLTFEVRPSDAPEDLPPGVPPGPAAEALARRKAQAVAGGYAEALTLAADTIVVLDGHVLNKPDDPAEASRMLRRLSGRTHTVYTGIALAHPASGREALAHEATAVTFADLSEGEIAAYVATGSPLDKAGAYGIQDDLGALFVEGVRGDYYNVVGLPLHRLYQTLKADFPDLLAEVG